MVTNPTFNFQPTFKSPQKRVLVWTVIVVALVSLALVVVMTASANPANSAEQRMQGLVSQLAQDRLTAQRHNAQRELENAGVEAVPALLVALHSDNAVLRRNAADMLGFIAAPLATDGLQYALVNDPNPAVRRNAAWALGEINSFSSLPTLQHVAVLDSAALVRQTAQDSLARIRTRLALTAHIDERELNSYAVAPQSSEIIYVANRRDLTITRDAGKTWTTLPGTLPGLADSLVVSPASAFTLYAGVDGLGIYKSVDGGREWKAINSGLNIPAGSRFLISAIALDPTEPQRIVIATGVMLGAGKVEYVPLHLMVSNDGGAEWNVLRKNDYGRAVTQLAVKGNQVFALAGNQVLVYTLG